MRIHTISLVFFLCLFSSVVLAQQPESLPFDVKLGGQVPVPAGSVAKVPAPVSNDALLEAVVPDNDTVFINFFISDANGNVTTENSSAKEIIMITGGNKTKINQTMSGNALPPGTYLGNIMAQSVGKTSRIVFRVK